MKRRTFFALVLACMMLFTSCGQIKSFSYDGYDPSAAVSPTSGKGDDHVTGPSRTYDPTFTRITVAHGDATENASGEPSGTAATEPETSEFVFPFDPDDFTLPEFSEEGKPLFWKVTTPGSEGTLYIFGSIHVARYGEKLVPRQVKEVLYKCDALAVESDVLEIENSTAKSLKYNYTMIYSDGSKVKDHMPKELYDRLCAFVKAYGYGDSMSFLQIYDCSFWVSFIEQMLMMELGVDAEYGVDRTLLKLAKEEGISIIELEDAIETIKALAGPENDDYALIALEDVLMSEDFESDIKEYQEQLYEMLDSWKSGDLEREKASLEEDYSDLSEEEIKIVEAYNKKILDDRNVKMIEKAEKMIENGMTVLYVVGNAHVVGKNGLIDVLTEKGYSIERIETKLP